MPRYRINCLDATDRVARKFFVWCEDDAAALRLARKLHHPHRVEVLQDDVRLVRLDGEGASNLQ